MGLLFANVSEGKTLNIIGEEDDWVEEPTDPVVVPALFPALRARFHM